MLRGSVNIRTTDLRLKREISHFRYVEAKKTENFFIIILFLFVRVTKNHSNLQEYTVSRRNKYYKLVISIVSMVPVSIISLFRYWYKFL